MTRRFAFLGLLVLTLFKTGCGGDECVAGDALQAELTAASPGDTVRFDSCVFGPLDIPPGVTLAGGGDGVIVASAGEIGVRMTGGAPPTRLEGVRIETSGTVGVRAGGPGAVALSEVTVVAERGVGIGVVDVSAARLMSVRVTGQITDDNEDDPVFLTVTPEATATVGLVLSGVADAQLNDVLVENTAEYGAVIEQSAVSWDGGGVTGILGHGILARDSDTDLRGIGVVGTRQGLRGLPHYGAIVSGGSTSSTNLDVRDNARYGLVVIQSPGRHSTLRGSGNGDAVLWVGESDGVEVDGMTDVTDNTFAAIVVVDSTNVTIRDSALARTASRTSTLGGDVLRGISVGDGIHLSNSYTGVSLQNLSLSGNARVGLMMELGPMPEDHPSLSGVRVEADGDALGAIAGRPASDDATQLVPAPLGTWDLGIERLGAAIVNDAAFTGRLDIAGAVTPSMLPDPAASIAGAVTPSM